MDGKDHRIKTGRGYEFAQLSEGEILDLKSIEDKINRDKPNEIVVIAYQKDQKP